MGITGLIPFLEKASSKVNLKDLRGTTVAVDTYCWLHKGVYTCADKLVRGEDTDLYIQYCLKYVQMLLSFDIKPILVFDGCHLPAKALTEHRRRESRQQSKKRAAELLRLGKVEEARSHMRRCVDVTHAMALKLIKECRQRNVDCIVAPYEADAQMAWLNKVDIAQYIITEDSDLTLFGAKKVIFKLDLVGNGLLVEADKLYLAMGCREDKYNFDKFRRMCIMSGCDYLDSLPGIGLAKACKFFLLTEQDDLKIALKKIPQYLKMKNLEVTDEYIESFLKAEATFRHMYIYNPLQRRMERLNNLEVFQTDERYCINAGKLFDDYEKAFNLAIGNLNPFTFEQLDTWHPDTLQQATEKFIKRAKHKSIWKSNYTSVESGTSTQTAVAAIFFKKVDFNSKRIEQEIVENIQAEVAKPAEAEIYAMYKYTATQSTATPTKIKRKRSVEDQTPPTSPATTRTRHNPFVKLASGSAENCKELSPKVCENGSLLRVLSPKKLQQNAEQQLTRITTLKRSIFASDTEQVQVKSRFFASNIKQATQTTTAECKDTVRITQSNSSYASQEDLTAEIVKIESETLIKQEQLSQLYNSPSPQRRSKPNEDIGIAPSHTDSGIESLASDNLYQADVLTDHVVETLPCTKVEKSEHESILISDESCNSTEIESTQPRVIKPLEKFAVTSKAIARLGLSRTKAKSKTTGKSTKNSASQSSSTAAGTAQTRLSMFGFQKRPALK